MCRCARCGKANWRGKRTKYCLSCALELMRSDKAKRMRLRYHTKKKEAVR